MPKRTHDGIKKRCGCARKRWGECPHPWHFWHFHRDREYRFSLDMIAQARNERPPRSREDAEGLRDRLRIEIRAGTFKDPHAEPEPIPADTRPTFGYVADQYRDRYVRVPTRRARAGHAIELHLDALKRAEVPIADGRQTIRLGEKPIADITKADVEAVRDAQRAAMRRALGERTRWDEEAEERAKNGDAMNRPRPRFMVKSGEAGINRLLARLRALFNWAIAEGFVEQTPFKKAGVTVVKLEGRAEKPRRRRLLPGEEAALIQAASPHLQALIVAGLETGCRVGELLTIQFRDLAYGPGPKRGTLVPRRILLPAEKTKTYEAREIPITSRLAAVIEMRRTGPDGKDHSPDACVFGNEVGEEIASIKTAWRAACRRAGISNLHFHDLRREFGSRVRETPGNSDHEVRDLLGHANISTTSRYLGSTPETRERAMQRFEKHQVMGAKTVKKGSRQPKTELSHTGPSRAKNSDARSTAADGSEVVELKPVN
jgi:integrase